ncbi:MAG: biopolymer transporter ExbD [Bdellovibrionales bacterium]|nr:biopolymer transporter ExbD [Bdellovibrionales bacterium]
MGAKISGEEDNTIAEINIVPFVDIILVVLIIFMVTTPFIMKPSINVNLPKAASGEDSAPSQLAITVAADGRTLLNGRAAVDEEISIFANNLSKTHPEVQAIITADRDVTHGRVVTLIDIVKGAGVKKFAITIDKK